LTTVDTEANPPLARVILLLKGSSKTPKDECHGSGPREPSYGPENYQFDCPQHRLSGISFDNEIPRSVYDRTVKLLARTLGKREVVHPSIQHTLANLLIAFRLPGTTLHVERKSVV
jgi:hypothetical protein